MRAKRGTCIERGSKIGLEWTKKVKERDGKCLACGRKEKLHAHHILNFKDFPEKRFDLDNGMTLCVTCHNKLEKMGKPGHRKGIKHTKESKERMRLANLGKTPINKGIHKNEDSFRKCKKCEKIKSIEDFERNRELHRYTCRDCRNELRNIRYKTKKEFLYGCYTG
jgi:5-methylcytosine-specific restriction endonuclease McrA